MIRLSIVSLILTFYLRFISTSTWFGENQPCADFNYGAKKAAAAGLEHAFLCPKDNIAETACNKPYPVKSNIEADPVHWNDVVIYCLVGKAPRVNVQSWWLNFFEKIPLAKLDLVLVGDACKDDTDNCEDTVQYVHDSLNSTFRRFLNLHIVRGLPHVDVGYYRLACKTVTGMKKVYELFPNKKYFFKIDDDTVLFPQRLIRFLSTLNAFHPDPTTPVYFGTLLNDHKAYILCNEVGINETTSQVIYKEQDQLPAGATAVCIAQGGAGYGLNNAAMRLFLNTPKCTKDMDLETVDEDTYIGFRIYQASRAIILHCGAFRPHGALMQSHAHYAISFHHIQQSWIDYTNVTELVDIYKVLH